MLDDHATERLIDTIYEAILDRSDWAAVCDRIAAFVPGTACFLRLYDMDDRRNVGIVQSGFEATASVRYRARWVHHDPILTPLERAPVGAVVRQRDLVPQAEFFQTEFWNDWLRLQGDIAGASMAVLARDAGRQATITLRYSHRSAAIEAEADAALSLITPHLRRVFDLWRRAMDGNQRLAIVETCLGTLPMPLALVDGRRRLRFAGDGVEAILRRMDGLVICARHKVHALDEDADAQLGRAIRRAARSPRDRPPLVMIPRDGEGGRYIVSAHALSHEHDDDGFGGFSFYDGETVALTVLDPSEPPRIDHRRIADAFGLTPSEGLLAAAMLEGATVSDYARARDVSRYTVRNQLSSVMRKTATARQSDLVSLLTRIATAS